MKENCINFPYSLHKSLQLLIPYLPCLFLELPMFKGLYNSSTLTSKTNSLNKIKKTIANLD